MSVQMENKSSVQDTHNSILELLSVTDAAVRALDKSTRSHSSHCSQNSRDSRESVDKSKTLLRSKDLSEHLQTDSGVGPTQSGDCKQNIGRSGSKGSESDVSTTASDVLIASTNVDPNDKTDPANASFNTSASSTRSRNLDSFNTANAQKVKVSRRHLKEIVSPRESSQAGLTARPRDKTSGNNSVSSGVSAASKTSGNKTGNLKQGSETSSRPPSGSVHDHDSVSSSRKHALVPGPEKSIINEKTASNKVDRTKIPFEKHFPKSSGERVVDVSLVSKHSQNSDRTASEGNTSRSTSSSQPEIITVPEQIITITATNAVSDQSSDDSLTRSDSMQVDEFKPNSKFAALSKLNGLRQGSLTRGQTDHDSGSSKSDVYISEFRLSDKQRLAKE